MRYLRPASLSTAFALFLSVQYCPLTAFAAADRVPASPSSAGKTEKATPKAPVVDDFAALPANDPIYGYLKATVQAGWTDRNWVAGNNEATRSEAALEVARVIFTVTARAKTDATWTDTASKPAARALRTLLATLRPELAQLGVETREVSGVIDRILQTKPAAGFEKLSPNPAPLGGTNLDESPVPASASRQGSNISRGEQSEKSRRSFRTRLYQSLNENPFANTPLENAARNTSSPQSEMTLSFSQRLRVTTAVQSLANESGDPLGRLADTTSSSSYSNPSVGSVRANATLNLTSRIALRADYAQQRLARPAWGLRNGLLNSLERQSEYGGGVDVTPLDNMKLTGNLLRQDNGVKVGGGVRFSAWQNRLTLGANLSRLLPEDSQAFAATATQFDVNFGLTQSVTFNLLYQSLFRADSPARPERFVGFGLGLKY